MRRATHIIGGITAGLVSAALLIEILPDETVPFFVFGSAVGGLIPDIDTPLSSISQMFPLFRKLYEKTTQNGGYMTGHRGVTHSLLGSLPLLVACLLSWYNPYLMWLTGGFWIGDLSHLLLDALNPTGIPLFYPYKRKITLIPYFLTIQTNTASEKFFRVLLFGGMIFAGYKYVTIS